MDSKPYEPHPNLSPEINANIEQSMIDGGADLTKMKIGDTLIVRTINNKYTITKVRDEDPMYLISGHKRFCPTPIRCMIPGSTWGGHMLKSNFIGRNMRMEFTRCESFHDRPRIPGDTVTTSMVTEVEELP